MKGAAMARRSTQIISSSATGGNGTPVHLPAARKGRKTAARQTEYDAELAAFARYLLEFKSTLDFVPGSRGWCYLLEGKGVITKGEFASAERVINGLRKSGGLPIDFCAS